MTERREAANTLRDRSHTSCITPTQLHGIMETFKNELLEQIRDDLKEHHTSVVNGIEKMSDSLNDVCRKMQASDSQISKDIKHLSHIVDVRILLKFNNLGSVSIGGDTMITEIRGRSPITKQ